MGNVYSLRLRAGRKTTKWCGWSVCKSVEECTQCRQGPTTKMFVLEVEVWGLSPPDFLKHPRYNFSFTVLKVEGAEILKHSIFFMNVWIYIYVEKCKIIDQKNTYQVQDRVYLLRRKEICQKGYR